MLRNVTKWYARAFDDIPSLVPFYDRSDIEDRMRALKIWRHPVARLRTAGILQFKHPTSESWRTWNVSSNLQDFGISGNAITVISTFIEEYIQTIESELIQIGMESTHARDDVIQTFKSVIDDFSNVRFESTMGSNFVMWVWQFNRFLSILAVT